MPWEKIVYFNIASDVEKTDIDSYLYKYIIRLLCIYKINLCLNFILWLVE